ncbi:MAG: hypothetical protein ACE5DR_00145 [Thermodesulfobacteriota bacterium]
MHEEILEYLRNSEGVIDSEDSVLEWWKGLQSLKPTMDELTEALEELEINGAIEKQVMEKDYFIYRIRVNPA